MMGTFVRPDQIKEEFKRTLDLMIVFMKTLISPIIVSGLSYRDPQNKDKYFLMTMQCGKMRKRC